VITATLNPQAIENLRAISPDDDGIFLGELVDIFLADTPSQIAEIEKSIADGNAPDLTRAAHSIKGSASNFGATELSEIAKEIELHGKTAAFEKARALVPALHDALSRIQPALEKLKLGT
jgi:HPt (histidine-containing phosphotransfer) domain-containing protein